MEDSYVAEKWAKDLYDGLNSYLEKNISDIEEVFVLFDDDVGSIYNLDYKNPGEYKDYEASATIHITLLLFFIILNSGCTNSSNNMATISVNSNSQYVKTFEDLNLGILYDFDLKLPDADASWVNLWIIKIQ